MNDSSLRSIAGSSALLSSLLVLSIASLSVCISACSSDAAPDQAVGSSSGGATTSGGSTTDSSASGGASTNTSGGSGDTGGIDLPTTAEGTTTTTDSGSDDGCSIAILGDPGSNPAANFQAWIAERGPVVDRYSSDAGLSTLMASDLNAYDIVMLDQLKPEVVVGVSPDELAAWVQGGGAMVVLSGYGDYDEALAKQNELLAPLELGFSTDSILWGPVTDFAVHPITQGLTSITFIGGRQVQSLPGDPVIMTLQEPPLPVGVVAERGAGRAFLFGDEWITYDSEWSAIPEIQVMWVNIFDWLAECKLEIIIR